MLSVYNSSKLIIVNTHNYRFDFYLLFQVEKLKVNDLKAYLQEQGIEVNRLKKAELVTKVYQHLGIDEPS